jgi:hypothetical protein
VKSPTNSQQHEQASATFANPTVSIDFPMREIFAYAVWDDTMRSPILDLTKIRNTNPRMHLPQISALARPTHFTRPDQDWRYKFPDAHTTNLGTT